ncbi:MAG: hypothetical protein MNPFHGCM_01849 [Gemmatimonadaceae bacterium]|nr:hypothetical protein [Gemmatimonadaceae bacterium]
MSVHPTLFRVNVAEPDRPRSYTGLDPACDPSDTIARHSFPPVTHSGLPHPDNAFSLMTLEGFWRHAIAAPLARNARLRTANRKKLSGSLFRSCVTFAH